MLDEPLTLRAAYNGWVEDVRPAVVAEYGEDDADALAQSWNLHADSLRSDGRLTELQYHHGPDDERADEDLPDDADDVGGELLFLLDKMGYDLDVTAKAGEGGVISRFYAVDIRREDKVFTWAIAPGSALMSDSPPDGEAVLAILEYLADHEVSNLFDPKTLADLHEIANRDVSLYIAQYVGCKEQSAKATPSLSPGCS